MIGACKPTVLLLDDAVDVLSKDNSNPWCPTVVRNDTTTPSSSSTLPRRHRKRTVSDPSDSFVVMLGCLLTRHCLTEPLLDAAITLQDFCRLFNPVAVVSCEPTSIDCPVTGRSASAVRNNTATQDHNQPRLAIGFKWALWIGEN
jgi:hypothetical protein